jgi:hypothetical protein
MMDRIKGVKKIGELYSFLCWESRRELKTHYCNKCCSILKCDRTPCPEYKHMITDKNERNEKKKHAHNNTQQKDTNP